MRAAIVRSSDASARSWPPRADQGRANHCFHKKGMVSRLAGILKRSAAALVSPLAPYFHQKPRVKKLLGPLILRPIYLPSCYTSRRCGKGSTKETLPLLKVRRTRSLASANVPLLLQLSDIIWDGKRNRSLV
jgi:hypothetical protein